MTIKLEEFFQNQKIIFTKFLLYKSKKKEGRCTFQDRFGHVTDIPNIYFFKDVFYNFFFKNFKKELLEK